MAEKHDPQEADWFNSDLTEVPPAFAELLAEYAGVPREDAVAHVLRIRDKAFKIRAYPCIGQFRFLVLVLRSLPIYPTLVSRLRSDPAARYIDLGVGLGQDLRRLVADGVPSAQTVALDVDPDMMALGAALFNDAASLQTTQLTADICAADQLPEWPQLRGAFTFVHASGFFTLWPRAQSLDAACVVARMCAPGAVIAGRQAGSVEGVEARGIWAGSRTFFHSPESWAAFWAEVGARTGTRWRVEAALDSVALHGVGHDRGAAPPPYHFDKKRRLIFEVHLLP